jgi:hypothetical protein
MDPPYGRGRGSWHNERVLRPIEALVDVYERLPCNRWTLAKLKVDAHGDFAHEFLGPFGGKRSPVQDACRKAVEAVRRMEAMFIAAALPQRSRELNRDPIPSLRASCTALEQCNDDTKGELLQKRVDDLERQWLEYLRFCGGIFGPEVDSVFQQFRTHIATLRRYKNAPVDDKDDWTIVL